MGRFLNADGLASTGQGVLGNNMFAYCNNNPTNYKDCQGAFSVDATRTGDTINITIKDEDKWGPVGFVVVVDMEFNLVEDYEFEWCDYTISVGSTGIIVTTPYGYENSYQYNTDWQTPTSIEIPIDSNNDSAFLKFSDVGMGFGGKYEKGIQSYSVTIYPYLYKGIEKMSEKLPLPPAGGGGYSNFGAGSIGGGAIWPLRNTTFLVM